MFSKCVLFSLLFASALAFAPKTNNFNITYDDIGKVLQQLLDTQDFLKIDKAEQVALLNDYSEILFYEANGFIMAHDLDPLLLANIDENFEWLIFSGEMSFSNGFLKGIGTLTRGGDVTIFYEYPILKLHLPISFENLWLEYDYLIQFMGIGPTGVMSGSVTGSKYTIDIDLDLPTLKAKLSNFKLNTLGDVGLEFHGGIFEWMLNIFLSMVIPLVTPIIRLVLDGFLEPSVNSIVNIFNIVVEQILGTPSP